MRWLGDNQCSHILKTNRFGLVDNQRRNQVFQVIVKMQLPPGDKTGHRNKV